MFGIFKKPTALDMALRELAACRIAAIEHESAAMYHNQLHGHCLARVSQLESLLEASGYVLQGPLLEPKLRPWPRNDDKPLSDATKAADPREHVTLVTRERDRPVSY